MSGENMNAGDDIDLIVWWTPDCGALHIETNPVVVSMECPDGLTGWSDE